MTNTPKLIRYLTVGVSGFAVDVLFYVGLAACLADASPSLLRLAAFLAASTWNWYLNRRWTFRSYLANAPAPREAVGQWLRFLVTSLAGGLFTVLIFAWLHADHAWPGLWQLWPLFLSTVPAGLTGFALSVYWVYGTSRADTPAGKKRELHTFLT